MYSDIANCTSEASTSSPRPQIVTTSPRSMILRRLLVLLLNGATIAALTAMMWTLLATSGWTIPEVGMLVAFMVTLPWLSIGFWNAVIGFMIARLAKDTAVYVNPAWRDAAGDQPIFLRTALAVAVRNEDPHAVIARLEAMQKGLDDAGVGEHFAFHVLSDSSNPEICAEEEAAVREWQLRAEEAHRIHYRRRSDNAGFKAGNVREFCLRYGNSYDLFIPLDADSAMSAAAILRLVRCMQVHPEIGILQGLVVGAPATSFFARVFQFGMRLGMRSYTLGSAWWQGDCGPYWGHNAIWRVRPFTEHCELPVLPGKGPLSGWVLSHDQVEAVLMRRAGYEVRVLPVETESFEENPPNLLEFIRRELRWCQGNLQYLKLLRLSGLKPVSRVQLVLAILMFVSAPAWLAFMATGAVIVALGGAELIRFDATPGIALFVIVLTMIFAPKIATVLDILADARLRRAFGGAPRVAASWFVELVFAALMAPVIAVAVSLFIAGLPFGKAMGWGAQIRDNRKLPLALCAAKLWPQTLFGLSGFAWAAAFAPGLVWPLLPVILGPAVAIPFARLTSGEAAGRLALASRLWRLPEETAPPECLLPLRLPAHASLGVRFGQSAPLFAGDMAKADA